MLDGVTIKVGGEEMVLPPLNWKATRKFFKAVTSGALDDPDMAVDLMPELLLVALVRNYPELTQVELEEKITPGELMAAIPELLKLSGFMQASVGEA